MTTNLPHNIKLIALNITCFLRLGTNWKIKPFKKSVFQNPNPAYPNIHFTYVRALSLWFLGVIGYVVRAGWVPEPMGRPSYDELYCKSLHGE